MPFNDPTASHSAFIIPNAPNNRTLDDRVHPSMRGKVLRWLNGQHKERLAGHLFSAANAPGFVIVQGKDIAETTTIAESLGLTIGHVDTLNNRITHYEMVLGMIPVEESERRRKLKHDHARFLCKNLKDDFTDSINALPTDGIAARIAPAAEFADRAAHAHGLTPPMVQSVGVTPAAIPVTHK